MAYYEFDNTNHVQVASGDAFHPVTGGEHSTAIVQSSGLVLVVAHGDAMRLDDATWEITVDGFVEVAGLPDESSTGIALLRNGLGDVSNITVGSSGTVTAPDFGIFAQHSTNITNHGAIGGSGTGIFEIGAGAYTIDNSGLIEGYHAFGIKLSNPGTCTILNSGTIHGGYRSIFDYGPTTTYVTNSGHIVGDVVLAGKADIFADVGTGFVVGIVDLGDGNDSFSGNGSLEVVRDGGNSDTVHLGGGNDTYIAVRQDLASFDGTDQIGGGPGDDFYTASGAIASVHINLGNGPYLFGRIPANTASGQEIGIDHISGFESADGGHGNDLIFGSNAVNTLRGNAGNDMLSGLGGADFLLGGKGADILRGGLDKDTLTGGTDADRFVFASAAETANAWVNRDVILDFSQAEADKIDIHLIDADMPKPGNQAFVFIGSDSFAHYHSLHPTVLGMVRFAGGVVQGNVDANLGADFTIAVQGAAVLHAGDFVL